MTSAEPTTEPITEPTAGTSADPTTEPAVGTSAEPIAGGLADLDFFHGTWAAPGQFHQTPFNEPKPIEMTIIGSSRLSPHWLHMTSEEAATPENAHLLRATYVWGYDDATGTFTADWFDSNGGRARQTSPGWDGDVLVFTGTMTLHGATVPLRDTFTRFDDDHFHHVGEVDLGEGWLPVDEENATRVPAGVES